MSDRFKSIAINWNELVQNISHFTNKTRRILSYFKPFWKTWIFLFIASLFLSGLGLVNPLIIKFLIDDVLLGRNLTLLTLLMLFYLGINIFLFFFGILTDYLYKKISQGILYNIRNQFFEHLESLHLGFFHKERVGDILTRLGSDITGVEEFVSLIFNRAIISLITLLTVLVICLYLNWQVTLLTFPVIPLYILSQRYYALRLHRLYAHLRRRYSDLTSFLEERLSAMALIQIFVREPSELAIEKRKAKRIVGLELRSTITSSLSENIMSFLTFLVLLIILWIGGLNVIGGAMTLGTLLAIYSYLGGLFDPIEDLAGLYTDVQSSLVSIDRVFQFLDAKTAVPELEEAFDLPETPGEIILKNVSYAYPDGRGKTLTLKQMNFRISPGETIGLVGPSGAGKTTLLGLICRFFDPVEGSLLVNGFDIREVRTASLRKQIGLISQDVILFNTTIKENICYGNPGASLKDIKQVANIANIDEFIEELPQRYDTEVGVRGLALSAGQRQRIALARTILKDPKILLMDEASSFLDPASELTVIENIMRLRDKTKIVVSNRISTLERMDRILVMRGGRIVEKGGFGELLQKKGYFFRFYSHQIGGFSAFEERLDHELQMAGRYHHPVFVTGIKITNVDYLTAYWGESEVIRMLEHIAVTISSLLPAGSFSIQDQKHRNIYYAVLPRIDKSEAINVYHRLAKEIANKFGKIKIKCGLAKSEPGLSIEELLEQSLPS